MCTVCGKMCKKISKCRFLLFSRFLGAAGNRLDFSKCLRWSTALWGELFSSARLLLSHGETSVSLQAELHSVQLHHLFTLRFLAK